MAYTNPSFCRQSEYMPEDRGLDDLPPPPQFQADEPPPSPSPPPPPPLPQSHQHHYGAGQANAGFQYRNDEIVAGRTTQERYCYLDERKMAARGAATLKETYAMQVNERRPIMHEREVRSRYEYILGNEDEEEEEMVVGVKTMRPRTPECVQVPKRVGSARYAHLPENGANPRANETLPAVFNYQRRENPRNIPETISRYALVPVNQLEDEQPNSWRSSNRSLAPLVTCQRSNSTRGRYARVPTQEVMDPPSLPDRNIRTPRNPEDTGYASPKNNIATQKLHEILTTPRKPRSRSEERTLSPSKRFGPGVAVQRGTPTGSPSGRFVSSPSRTAAVTPNGRRLVNSSPRGDSSPNSGPHTSTPNKEPSARRCLPLNLEGSSSSRSRDTCPASNCGRPRYAQRASMVGSPGEPPPRYAYLDGFAESIPMVVGSPKYQVVSASDEKSVESAFMARTAVVPPLSPPHSEANTTLASGLEKGDRRNAPLLLLLVGILTCGLALYLSWSQGRRYYLDSAAGCGACCALAGACRSLRRTWTGLGLAGLSALSCAGLLLIAAKSPRAGTPLHDVTAGALCGVSLLGAALALLALLQPRCHFSRHRRVHSWIPRFSP